MTFQDGKTLAADRVHEVRRVKGVVAVTFIIQAVTLWYCAGRGQDMCGIIRYRRKKRD